MPVVPSEHLHHTRKHHLEVDPLEIRDSIGNVWESASTSRAPFLSVTFSIGGRESLSGNIGYRGVAAGLDFQAILLESHLALVVEFPQFFSRDRSLCEANYGAILQ